ncbi:MAG TPA: PHB depolymerase family esterase [Thermoanaerobaculia bacterium]|nr:PHB depolymerase family esterase [Thermoanaerobaculia bacterium]
MRLVLRVAFTLSMALSSLPVTAQGITKEILRSGGQDRAYYLFVPKSISPSATAPLIVLLHGSGRNGASLVEPWKDLARKEGFIIVGPDALSSQGWKIPEDGPDFLHELVEALKTKYPINARRVYLFGHSAGAVQALYLSLLESEYFAATAVHAGSLRGEDTAFIDQAKRKIPISIYVGTNDQLFPLAVVRSTRDALNTRGFTAELTEIKGHTHFYYDRAGEINHSAWEFLKKHELAGEPKYEQHQFAR